MPRKNAPKMEGPTQKLKNVRMVVKGDTKAWTQKVAALIAQGANPRVLDTYKTEQSIITHFIMSDLDAMSLPFVVKFLLDQGVTPSEQVFVDCLFKSTELADLVMDAYTHATGNPINVNNLNIYGTPIQDWAAKEILKNKGMTHTVKYLVSKGLNTTAKTFSINDLEALLKNLRR